MDKIYVVTEHAYDLEMVGYTKLICAFRDKEEAEVYRDALNIPWQTEIIEVEFSDYT